MADTDTTDLSGWKYEIEAWRDTFASDVVELVKSVDNSEPYEMDRKHIFRLANGKYAFVSEQGCSCYETSNASIDIFPTEQEALAAFDKA